jgi:hypothetical protein
MRIRYFCHAGQETGYGRAATEIALALLEAGDVELQIVPLNPSLTSFQTGRRETLLLPHARRPDDDAPFDVAIVHTMPLDCQRVAEKWLHGADGIDKVSIAYTTWEGLDVPEEVTSSLRGHFADIWVPSSSTKDAFLRSRVTPTFVLPHTYEQRPELPPPTRKDRFAFYYMGGWNVRKNPHGLIRAFVNAFGPDDPVSLTIHSPGLAQESFLAALAATGLEQAKMPRIHLSNLAVTDPLAVHELFDCFVTAARGESWNLPAFEAMLSGRMVIAPWGMGHDDFLFWDPKYPPQNGRITSARATTSRPQPAAVDVEMLSSDLVDGRRGVTFVTTGAQGLTSRTTWLDPDLVDLATVMREVAIERPALIRRYEPAARFGHEVVAQRALDRIRILMDRSHAQGKDDDDGDRDQDRDRDYD